MVEAKALNKAQQMPQTHLTMHNTQNATTARKFQELMFNIRLPVERLLQWDYSCVIG
jgi:hypothetical protein